MNSICKLFVVLSLAGCGGQEFVAADNKINEPNSAGKTNNLAGEAGESSSGGDTGSGGASNSIGGDNQTAGSSSAGTESVGGFNAGSNAGGTSNVGGSITDGGTNTAGTGTAGSAGSTAGTGGSTGVNPCSVSMKSFACDGVTWDWSSHNDGVIDMHTPAQHAWECPNITDEPPFELKSNFNGGTIRQCTESTFGSPNTLWCCTS